MPSLPLNQCGLNGVVVKRVGCPSSVYPPPACKRRERVRPADNGYLMLLLETCKLRNRLGIAPLFVLTMLLSNVKRPWSCQTGVSPANSSASQGFEK